MRLYYWVVQYLLQRRYLLRKVLSLKFSIVCNAYQSVTDQLFADYVQKKIWQILTSASERLVIIDSHTIHFGEVLNILPILEVI